MSGNLFQCASHENLYRGVRNADTLSGRSAPINTEPLFSVIQDEIYLVEKSMYVW